MLVLLPLKAQNSVLAIFCQRHQLVPCQFQQLSLGESGHEHPVQIVGVEEVDQFFFFEPVISFVGFVKYCMPGINVCRPLCFRVNCMLGAIGGGQEI